MLKCGEGFRTSNWSLAGWVGSNDYGYVASTDLRFAYYLALTLIVTFVKQHIGFCRFPGPVGIPLPGRV